MARFRKTAELKAEATFSIEPWKVARVSGAKTWSTGWLQAMPKGDGKVLERLGDREVPGMAEMLSVAGVW